MRNIVTSWTSDSEWSFSSASFTLMNHFRTQEAAPQEGEGCNMRQPQMALGFHYIFARVCHSSPFCVVHICLGLPQACQWLSWSQHWDKWRESCHGHHPSWSGDCVSHSGGNKKIHDSPLIFMSNEHPLRSLCGCFASHGVFEPLIWPVLQCASSFGINLILLAKCNAPATTPMRQIWNADASKWDRFASICWSRVIWDWGCCIIALTG